MRRLPTPPYTVPMKRFVLCLLFLCVLAQAEAQRGDFFQPKPKTSGAELDRLQKQAGQLIAQKFKLLKLKKAKRDAEQPALQEEADLREIDAQLVVLNRRLAEVKRALAKQNAENPPSPPIWPKSALRQRE
jgi:hypothetical protein